MPRRARGRKKESHAVAWSQLFNNIRAVVLAVRGGLRPAAFQKGDDHPFKRSSPRLSLPNQFHPQVLASALRTHEGPTDTLHQNTNTPVVPAKRTRCSLVWGIESAIPMPMGRVPSSPPS